MAINKRDPSCWVAMKAFPLRVFEQPVHNDDNNHQNIQNNTNYSRSLTYKTAIKEKSQLPETTNSLRYDLCDLNEMRARLLLLFGSSNWLTCIHK